jgi:photosystem II stability/assembly factor-like uncharacterized protein
MVMKIWYVLVVISGVSLAAHSQFTVIPTGTNSDITGLELHNDTIIITGREFSIPGSTNYFAKTYDFGNSLTTLTPPGPFGYRNFDFQVVQNNYYILSVQSNPYEHNYALKSTDFGNTWYTLYDTAGLFFTLTMLDTTFGIMTGTFGDYAMTQGGDDNWLMQDALYSGISASAIYGDSTILMLSMGGYAYLSENRGQSWGWCLSGSGYSAPRKIQFLNQDTIYAIYQDGANKTFFHFSFNGGCNWSWTTVGHDNIDGTTSYYGSMYDMYFDSPQHGYLVGDLYGTAIIAETNDYGQTWTQWVLPFNNKLLSILNVNDSIAFIGGSNGLLLKWDKTVPLDNVLSNEDLQPDVKISLYPNPANESVTIEVPENMDRSELIFTNMIGQTVLRKNVTSTSVTMDLTGFSNGIYFVHVQNGNQRITKKLIVQH